jgi:sporulation protein YlmC with PRC-barrel domain
MGTRFVSCAWIAALCAIAEAGVQEAVEASAPREPAPQCLTLTSGQALGMNVEDEDGDKLGDVCDLLVDPESGEIRYAVVKSGGFLGLGTDRSVVPWKRLEIAPRGDDADRCRARSTLSAEQLRAAPNLKRGDALGEELVQRVEAIFGEDERADVRDAPDLVRLTEMDRVVLRGSAGEKLGTIREVVIAPHNRIVAYAVAETTREAGGKQVALPMACLDYGVDEKDRLTATTPIETERLRGAPEYDAEDARSAPAATGAWIEELCGYYDEEPFWAEDRFAAVRGDR